MLVSNKFFNTERIAGVIVLYHPDQNVLENIRTYLDYVEILFAVDNSETKISDFVENLKNIPKIVYIDNNGNQGIAHALNVGAHKAIEMGYEWLLTMDQDSSFDPMMFKKYVQCAKKIPDVDQIAILSPNHVAKPDMTTSCSFSEKLIAITSGSLLNLHLYPIIGEFDERLFIDEVDHDYCLRAHIHNYKVIEIENIFLRHQIGNKKIIKRHGKIQFVNIHPPLRNYYITRNCLLIWSRYHNRFSKFTYRRLWHVVKLLLLSLAYDKNRLSRLKYIFMAIWHFLIGKMGKYEK